MNIGLFDYDLPKELIAQSPLEKRDASRLLCLGRKTGEIIHNNFRDLLKYLKKGDCLVINNTKVIPARLYGIREDTKGEVEFLLLNRLTRDEWEIIVRPGKKAKEGNKIIFGDGILTAEVLKILTYGNRVVKFNYDGIFEEVLEKAGRIPLPHYITEELKDKSKYQTIYAKYDGSAAAPTAGLHFTKEFLKEIEESGVSVTEITLHVGLGTFRPVKAQNIEEHKMHSERYNISQDAAFKINTARKNGGRIIAVGTTSARTLESASDENGYVTVCNGSTDIFIYPGYKFKAVDGLLTNFHLPKSTLIMLVSAFCGRENTMAAYESAIKERYRFFSFGDAMLII